MIMGFVIAQQRGMAPDHRDGSGPLPAEDDGLPHYA